MKHLEFVQDDRETMGLLPDELIFSVRIGGTIVGNGRITPFGEQAEIGYEIVTGERGKGLGTAVCSMLLERVPSYCTSVFAQVDTDNTPSIAILLKNGFTPSQRLEGSILYTREAR